MFAYLLKLDINNNNNRYYKMTQENDVFIIEYGRVGAKPMVMKRPMYLWQETYAKQIAQGYIDRTEYLTITENYEYRAIENPEVNKLVDFLLYCQDETIKNNYSVSYSDVSSKMINDAQELLYKLSLNPTVKNAESILPQLFVIIPRKMKNLINNIPNNDIEIVNILQREQELLDVMKSKITSLEMETDTKKTILETYGMEIYPVTEKTEIEKIKSKMTDMQDKFVKAFKVYNKKTDEQFNKYVKENHISHKDIHFLYHGSKNMNYWSILTNGQKLNPKAPITGKMFGHGLYYANLARKSIGYTSLKGAYWSRGKDDKAYLAIFKVAYNNPYEVYKHEPWMSGIRTISDIHNHDALFAHKGYDLYNDEIIVYNEQQVTLRYLIELREKPEEALF